MSSHLLYDWPMRGREGKFWPIRADYLLLYNPSDVSLPVARGEMILISLPFLTWSVIINFWHLIITVWTRDISTPYELIHWEPRLLTTRQDKDNFTIKISLPSIFLKFLWEDKECQHIIIHPPTKHPTPVKYYQTTVIFAKIFDKKGTLSNNRRYVQNSYCLYSSGYDLHEELMNLNNTKDVNLISFTFMYQNDTFVKEDRKSSVDLFHIR